MRDAAMAAVELGLPMRPDPVLRLLGDRNYFESLLPISVDDSRWELYSKTGTQTLWQWWYVHSETYRTTQLEFVRKTFQRLPDDTFYCLTIYDLAYELPLSTDRAPAAGLQESV